MNESKATVSDLDLQCWVDERLAAQDQRVERALDARPQLRAKAEHYRVMNRTLREHLDAELAIPVPPSLTHAALHPRAPLADAAPAPGDASRVRSAANSGRFAQAAALLVAVAIGVAVGWGARATRDATKLAARGMLPVSIPLIRAATVAHAAYTPEIRHPVEVGAGEQAHLVAWLSKRLGTPLKVPTLEAQGYHLVGGRLLPDAGRGVAAQFMFESAQGLRLTLFVRGDQGSDDTAFRYASSQGLSTFYWLDRGFGYALSGALPREAMLAVATEVYRQINP